jgi:hypothetical protein
VCGAAIEALPVCSKQDRAGLAFPDGKVDGSGRSGNERDGGGLVALPDDPQDAVTPLEGEVFDVGGARLADSKSVEAEENGERGVGVVVALGGEQEGAELGAVQPTCLGVVNLGAMNVLGGDRRDATVDVREPVEAAHR